jgi:hypothetical protein
MAIDINAIRGRLNKLQNTKRKSDLQWKPTPGKHQLRIVPYKFDKDNPFIELFFHYGINNKTYLSPSSFGRPDPIVEFAEKLKRAGDKDDWKAAMQMMPKLRTFVPVLVRGEEGQGVKFWGFGKTVYQEILGYIADPDYGDITDPVNGRDITVEYISADDAGTSYPKTIVRVKPNTSPLDDDIEKAKSCIGDQVAITELYSELTYDELDKVLRAWLNPDEAEKETTEKSVSQETLAPSTPASVAETTQPKQESTPTPTPAPTPTPTKAGEVGAAFDELFK